MAPPHIPATWTGSMPDRWNETPPQPLTNRRYLKYWWRSNAKLAMVTIVFWVLCAWLYVEFVAR